MSDKRKNMSVQDVQEYALDMIAEEEERWRYAGQRLALKIIRAINKGDFKVYDEFYIKVKLFSFLPTDWRAIEKAQDVMEVHGFVRIDSRGWFLFVEELMVQVKPNPEHKPTWKAW